MGCSPSTNHQSQPCASIHRVDASFDGASDDDNDDKSAASCTWGAAIEVGRLNDARVPELSGLVASTTYPGWFWGHNDSGQNIARLYLIDNKANVRATLTLPAVAPIDWEDIAAGPCAPQDPSRCLWIGDIGDNAHKRTELALIRTPEPPYQAPPTTQELTWSQQATVFRFQYPPSQAAAQSARPDAEAMVAMPSGALWILTKQDDGLSRIFQVTPDPSSTVIATEMGVLDLRDAQLQGGLSLRATAADLLDGQLLVRTYFRAWQFDLSQQLTGPVNAPPRLAVETGFDIQGESIAFGLDASIWHGSEGLDQPLWKLPCSSRNEP